MGRGRCAKLPSSPADRVDKQKAEGFSCWCLICQELSCTYLNFLLLILPLNNKNIAVLKAKMPMEQTLAHLSHSHVLMAETLLQHECPALGEWMEK